MKSKIRFISTLAILLIVVICTAQSNTTANNPDIEGIWKLVSTDLHTQKVNQYKIIANGHFFWYQVNAEGDINPFNGAGGTYELNGNSYKERVEHVLPQMKNFKDSVFEFDIEVSENVLKLKGIIPGSYKTFNEVFERVSPK
jgi:cell division protein YceG involved in septum cleavage